MELKLSDEVN